MSIIHRIPPAALKRDFVYRGWAFGLVPVYVGPLDAVAPLVATRNWCPDWLFVVAEGLFSLMVAPFIRDPEYPLLITGRIDGRPLADGWKG